MRNYYYYFFKHFPFSDEKDTLLRKGTSFTILVLQAVRLSRVNHSKIVEQLEKEKQKIQQDVERLEQMRLRRNSPSNTPRLTPIKLPHGSEVKDSKVKTDLYKTALLVREANKIAQYLKKDLVSTKC